MDYEVIVDMNSVITKNVNTTALDCVKILIEISDRKVIGKIDIKVSELIEVK